MSSFHMIENHSPLLTFLGGAFFMFLLPGLGVSILSTFRSWLRGTYLLGAGAILGLFALSLLIQLMSITQIIRPAWVNLAMILIVPISLNGWLYLIQTRPRSSSRLPRPPGATSYIIFALLAVALLINLLIAMAPSSKIDELYYHMLLPARLVADEGFRIYREPWQSAILPQMYFQIAAVPAHILRLPDSWNLVSWGFQLLLVIQCLSFLSRKSDNRRWMAICGLILIAGMYTPVWHVTGGAHALGDFGIVLAMLVLLDRSYIISTFGPGNWIILISLAILAAAGSKVSLLPICCILMLVAFLILISSRRSYIVYLSVPVLIFGVLYAPLMIGTWVATGSPFGPMLTNLFGSHVYDTSIQHTLQNAQLSNHYNLRFVLTLITANHSPLLWAACIALFFVRTLPRIVRAGLATLTLFQISLIILNLPYDPRFLGGLQFALALIFASAPGVAQFFQLHPRMTYLALITLVVPWLLLQSWYALPFVSTSLGLTDPRTFLRERCAFIDDFVALDTTLPADSVLLIEGTRLNNVYAPRPVYMDIRDIPPITDVFVFYSGNKDISSREFSWESDWKIGYEVYSNENAITTTYRTPGRAPRVKPLSVYRLSPLRHPF